MVKHGFAAACAPRGESKWRAFSHLLTHAGAMMRAVRPSKNMALSLMLSTFQKTKREGQHVTSAKQKAYAGLAFFVWRDEGESPHVWYPPSVAPHVVRAAPCTHSQKTSLATLLLLVAPSDLRRLLCLLFCFCTPRRVKTMSALLCASPCPLVWKPMCGNQ